VTPEQRIAQLEAELAREREEKARLLSVVESLSGVPRTLAGAGYDPSGYSPYDSAEPEPVLIPRVRIRMKTPEERAEAEAAHARMLEETRQRHQREQAHRQETKAAKRAAARVYFIQQDGGERLVKIGTTTRPVEVRLKELQAGQPHPLVILAHAPGGHYEEGRLHDRFGPHCVTGEWFRPHADLLAYAGVVGKVGVL
jgi:hypothetical protein